MRRLVLLFAVSLLAIPLFAKDVYLTIGGSVGVFRTDARIFNPSQTKDIQIQAYYLPVGNGNNSGVQPKTITIPKRSQVVFDDVVSSLFQSSGLGGIRLSSPDEFVATSRIYAGATNSSSSTPCTPSVNPCTLGQFITGLDAATQAKKNGVLIQLKSNAAFRTNVGLVNPNASAAIVTWRLYDKNNAVVAGLASLPTTIQPFGVVSPTNISVAGADLSDAWLGYTSDQPLLAYASVVDNGSTDPTYIAAVEDTNPPTGSNPPVVTAKEFDVELQLGHIGISPNIGAGTLKVGDKVIFHVSSSDVTHGFTLIGPTGSIVVPDRSYNPGVTVDHTFTVTAQGTYTYFCTNSVCGEGHTSMTGSFDVGTPTDNENGGKY
jgi:plastocyanin